MKLFKIYTEKEYKLIKKYKLRKGENNIKMKIKNKIKDLQDMFYGCKNLVNINMRQEYTGRR